VREELMKATKLLEPEPIPAPDASSVETMHDALRAALGHTSKVELKASFDKNNGLTLANVKLADFETVMSLLTSAVTRSWRSAAGSAPARDEVPLRRRCRDPGRSSNAQGKSSLRSVLLVDTLAFRRSACDERGRAGQGGEKAPCVRGGRLLKRDVPSMGHPFLRGQQFSARSELRGAVRG